MRLGTAHLLHVPLARGLLAQQTLLDLGKGLHVAPDQQDGVAVTGKMHGVSDRKFPPGVVMVVQLHGPHGRLDSRAQRGDTRLELGLAFVGQKVREYPPDPMIETAERGALRTDGYSDDDAVGIDRDGHVRRLLDEMIDVLRLWQNTGQEPLRCPKISCHVVTSVWHFHLRQNVSSDESGS